jgi:hypothetical protein
MKIRKTTVWMGTLPLLLGGFLAPAPVIRAADVPDSEQVSKLLSEAKTQAFQLKEDAVTMESFTRMNVSHETQAAAINQIRDHVNALVRQAAKLQDAESLASPWQKQSIVRILPFLDELEGYTSAVIEHLNGENRHTIAEYQDYLEANADYSADLAAMIANFADYGKAKERVARLAAKLEITTTKVGQ